MKQILQNMRNGKTEVIEVPTPKVSAGFVLVQTMASLVSSGTERNVVEFAEKNLLEKARSRPDLVRQVINKAKREGVLTTYETALNRLDQPLALGYSSSGIVIEVGQGVNNYRPGDRVVCAGGNHAVHAEYANIPVNLLAHLPDNVSFESGAFATVAAIALNGIRLANLQVGDSVLIIGLGLLGLLAAKLSVAAGCTVAGVDIEPAKVNRAHQMGFASSIRSDAENLLVNTRARGFDCVLICADTASNDTVDLAAQMARDRGRIICIGAVGLDLPRKPYYEKELFFQVSRSYGPGRYDAEYEEKGHDYPIGYVRWTEGRNLEAVVDLLSRGRLIVDDLISHRFSIVEGEKAYQLITGKSAEPFLGVLIRYSQQIRKPVQFARAAKPNLEASEDSTLPTLGVIGAGNYATAVFLPNVKKANNVVIKAIVSTNGVNAAQAAHKFSAENSASDSDFVIQNKDIKVVAVLTRHDSHADLVMRSLKAGKHVFCEKPLAINKSDLHAISDELHSNTNSVLTVGFNRRFAPMTAALQEFFKQRSEAMHLYYRINAGFIPTSHWLHDLNIGGGRIVGEGCHFIDFAMHIIGKPITHVLCHVLADDGKYSGDNAIITLDFSDGSLATISYLANGDKVAPKEYIEVFSGGKTAILNDFRTLNLFSHGRHNLTRSPFRQDKGHRAIWQAFIESTSHRSMIPIPYSELLLDSYAALAAVESARIGKKVDLEEFIGS